MGDLQGKTLLISGGSRGIGLAIAVKAAADGANVALVAKTAEPHPKLEGTIFTAAKAIEEAGGQALPIVGDVCDDASVRNRRISPHIRATLGTSAKKAGESGMVRIGPRNPKCAFARLSRRWS
jgi:NADP-dependent 3-hydroxy acid dehydrogenase YdfG